MENRIWGPLKTVCVCAVVSGVLENINGRDTASMGRAVLKDWKKSKAVELKSITSPLFKPVSEVHQNIHRLQTVHLEKLISLLLNRVRHSSKSDYFYERTGDACNFRTIVIPVTFICQYHNYMIIFINHE